MIKPLMPEQDVYSNKYALFEVDSIDDAVSAIKTAAKTKYDFDHDIKFLKNWTNNGHTLIVGQDESFYKREYENNITLIQKENEKILQLKIKDFRKKPIKHIEEITKELYKQCTNTA
jgi:hypothetical protein